MYDSEHNSNKYSVSSFNEISPIDSKFDAINKFYNDFKKLKDAKSQNNNTKQKKTTVLKNASLLYYELVNVYETEYNQVFESKDKYWRKKPDYKNLKNLEYQVDKVDKVDVTEKGKKEKVNETDQKLPPWVMARFEEAKDVITEGNESGLVTKIEKRKITLSGTKELVEGIIGGKIGKDEARKIITILLMMQIH